MSEKSKNGRAGTKQTNAKSDAPKTPNPKAENSLAGGESKSQDITGNSGDNAKKSDAPKSSSQTSTSHFSNVSTPEYRAGWDKIFGKSKVEQSSTKQLTKYEQRKALLSQEWRNYQETKDPKHLATICRNLPFFDHPEVGEEIAKLLIKS